MNILAIDPGTTHSALVIYDTCSARPTAAEMLHNDAAIERIRTCRSVEVQVVVIERVASYGMAVGETVFETVHWAGRFFEAALECGVEAIRLFRRDVKQHLCGHVRAKDANIRQRLIDLYGPERTVAIGTKKAPGPLFGFGADKWAALALARTFADTRLPEITFHA